MALAAAAGTGASAREAERPGWLPPENPRVAGLSAPGDLAAPEALGWSREQYDAARAYAREGWILWLVDALAGIALPALLFLSGAAGRGAAWLESRLRHRAGAEALFVAGMVVSLAALTFPLELLRFARAHRYGFATQGFAAWFADGLKGLAVACVLAVLVLVPLWRALRRWPRAGWAAGSAIAIAATILLMAAGPVFIAPLFNDFTPLAEGPLRERILSLARAQEIETGEVHQVDASRQSRHDNAYVAGLLGTERIVLYDTLLAAYAPEEIEFVMAHEIGHYRLHHLWKGIAAASAGILAGFFLIHRSLAAIVRRRGSRLGCPGPASLAAMPLAVALFACVAFIATPLASAISRSLEAEADRFALELADRTPSGRAAAVSAFQRMAARNFSDPDPPPFVEWWLYTHPSLGKRIRAAAGREMAITFDDLPGVAPAGSGLAPLARLTDGLLGALRRHDVPAVGFVNEGKLEADGEGAGAAADPARTALLRAWLDAGMELGNHGHAHLDLHDVTLDEARADVLRGETVTRPLADRFGRPLRFYRHPYLHTGRDAATRGAFESFLAGRGYRIAPVTIDNYDYVWAAAYDRASGSADRVLENRIAAEYLDYMLAVVGYYERQSAALFGREIRQILLLHANALNARAFDGLAGRLGRRGYRFITLDRALEDPAHGSRDAYFGPAGITWLHRWALTAGKRGDFFAGEPEVPQWVGAR